VTKVTNVTARPLRC